MVTIVGSRLQGVEKGIFADLSAVLEADGVGKGICDAEAGPVAGVCIVAGGHHYRAVMGFGDQASAETVIGGRVVHHFLHHCSDIHVNEIFGARRSHRHGNKFRSRAPQGNAGLVGPSDDRLCPRLEHTADLPCIGT